jgi:hypothetical protein
MIEQALANGKLKPNARKMRNVRQKNDDNANATTRPNRWVFALIERAASSIPIRQILDRYSAVTPLGIEAWVLLAMYTSQSTSLSSIGSSGAGISQSGNKM